MTKFNGNPELRYLGPPDYEIHEHRGYIYGRPLRDPQFVLVVDDSDGKGKMFKRNFMHTDGTSARWLVAQYGGVRLYCTSLGTYILTDKDVYSDAGLIDKLAAGQFERIAQ
jgi:hypothetical protein